jgi:hypothetical protein
MKKKPDEQQFRIAALLIQLIGLVITVFRAR